MKGNFECSTFIVTAKCIEQKNPICLEVTLTSLGSWYMETEEYPNGKFINYHAGPSPKLKFHESLIIEESNEDPLYVLLNKCGQSEISKVSMWTIYL